MYRVLTANHEVCERRAQLMHPRYEAPELLATKPNQLWSWDITKLKGPTTWSYFYLYVIIVARGTGEQAAPPQPARPFDPAHFMAIQAALTPAERALAQETAAQLSPEDRQTFMNQLGGMTVDEAVAFIRSALASVGKANA